MELKVVSKDKNTIEIELEKDETFVSALREKLVSDENVENAICSTGHPMIDKPKIFVRVKKGKPESALEKAVKKLGKEIEDFKTAFEKTEKQ